MDEADLFIKDAAGQDYKWDRETDSFPLTSHIISAKQ